MQKENKILHTGFCAKLKETAGETLVETLFALVIIVMAFTFFPTAIMAATNMAQASEEMSGTSSDEGREDTLITTGTVKAYITFKEATADKDEPGKWNVGSNEDIRWNSGEDGASYTVTFTAGNHLTSTEVAVGSYSQIEVECYKNSAEDGSNAPDYYFYEPAEVD